MLFIQQFQEYHGLPVRPPHNRDTPLSLKLHFFAADKMAAALVCHHGFLHGWRRWKHGTHRDRGFHSSAPRLGSDRFRKQSGGPVPGLPALRAAFSKNAFQFRGEVSIFFQNLGSIPPQDFIKHIGFTVPIWYSARTFPAYSRRRHSPFVFPGMGLPPFHLRPLWSEVSVLHCGWLFFFCFLGFFSFGLLHSLFFRL